MKKEMFVAKLGFKTATTLLFIGVAVLLVGVNGPQAVLAAVQVTLNWGDLSPLLSPDPDFNQNTPIGAEDDTYFSAAPNPHTDPYHGLGSATGGLNGFSSQSFPNVASSGLDMTVYYSNNNWDGNILEGPDLYMPGVSNPNPDRRVTGEYVVRMTRDHVGTRTPTTIVLVFSEPVYMDEYLVASLSIVDASHEHAIIRAFATADATGPVVKASELINISDLDTCAPLLLDQCVNEGPTPSNALTNVEIDPDMIDANNDGVYENVGTASDDGLYHVYGDITQPDGYGRIKVVYGLTPVRSIAVSFFATSTANANPFTDTAYTAQWISTIVAPHTFTPAEETAITLSQSSATVKNPEFFAFGSALILLALITIVVLRRRKVTPQETI